MNTARKVPPLISIMILIWKPPFEVLNHFLGNRCLNKIQGEEYYKKVTFCSLCFWLSREQHAKIWKKAGVLWAKRTEFWSRAWWWVLVSRIFPLQLGAALREKGGTQGPGPSFPASIRPCWEKDSSPFIFSAFWTPPPPPLKNSFCLILWIWSIYSSKTSFSLQINEYF